MEIKGYRIERVIGRGGMATVYLAEQETLGRPVALKVMNPSFASDASLAQRFLEEGPTAARLNDPQIVTVFDTGVDNGHYYLAMEYLPGGTLKQKIREGLTLERALNIAEQIGRGLAYAHSRSVIHRDIKPQNILFRDSGEPVITDFGIAKAGVPSAQLTLPGTTFGSPNYMSPEQAKGLALDARSDLYSFGVIFYEMLTGELPYRAEDSYALAQKHISAPLPQLPDRLKAFQPPLDKLLAKNPDERYTIAEQFVEDLREARQHMLADPPPTPPPAAEDSDADRTRPLPLPKPKPAPSRRRRWPLGLAALLVVGAGGGYVYLSQRPATEPTRPAAQIMDGTEPTGERTAATEPTPTTTVPAEPLVGTVATEPASTTAQEPATPAQTDTKAPDTTGPADTTPAQTAETGTLPAAVSAQSYLAEARALFEDDRYAASLEVLDQGLAAYPTSDELQTLRGSVQSALDERERLAQATTHLTRAQALLRTGRLDEAAAEAEQGLALAPGHPELLQLRDQIVTARDARDRQDQAEQLYAQAQQAYQQGDLEQSQQRISEGLALAPQHSGLSELQTRVSTDLHQRELEAELQREIRRLLDRAGEQFAADRLTTPADDNAYDSYRQVLAQDPENAEALAGLQRIADTYRDRAGQALTRGDLTQAGELIDHGLEVQPDDADLLALRQQLEQRRQLADLIDRAGKRLEAGDLQGSREAVDAGLALAPDDPRLLALRDELDLGQLGQGLATIAGRLGLGKVRDYLRQRSSALETAPTGSTDTAADITDGPALDEPTSDTRDASAGAPESADEQARIEQLLAQAGTYMDDLKLTTPRDANAYDAYRAVLELDPDNAEARRGLDVIVDRYLRWARGNLERGQYRRSLNNIDKGLRVEPGHRQLRALREEVLARQAAANRPVETPTPRPAPPSDPCAVDRSSRECWCKSFGMFCE